MLNQQHPHSAVIKRGALVLLFLCSLSTLSMAAGSRLLTGVRTSVNGDATRITFAGTAPLAYGVRRVDERTLMVELPGVVATRLAASYTPASPLVAGFGRLATLRGPDQSLVLHAPEGAVHRPDVGGGQEAPLLRVLDDPVAVPLPGGEAEEDVELHRPER